MKELNENINIKELNDGELEQVVGGYKVGDTVQCSANMVAYCSNCGRLQKITMLPSPAYAVCWTEKRSIGSSGNAAAISPASSKRRFWVK